MKGKIKGFTVLELLGVIIVLAFIAMITVPIVTNHIKTSKRQALLETAMNLVHAVNYEHVEASESQIYRIENGKIQPSLEMKGSVNGNGFIEIDQDKNIRIYLSDGSICAQKHFSDINVKLVEHECDEEPGTIVNLDQSGASVPQLDNSMIAVRYNGENWVKADQDNIQKEHQWYDYQEKMWANMVVIRKNKQSKYLEAPLGTKIDEADILGYFVGIPSFTYQISEGTSERSFDVKFTTKQNRHSAFQWGTEEITGFWFGKYEVSGSLEEINVLPNKAILKNTSLKNMYQVVDELNELKKKNQYATKVSEIHLIKNTEWGAVAILSQSQYGVCSNSKCTKVAKNETWNTGYSDKNSPYNSTNGVTASTTGNVYGVYDMNGGSWEFTMGTNKVSSLGTPIHSEQYDSYTSEKGIKGDLTTEDGTSAWYGSSASFLNHYQNWFIRGGDVNTNNSSIFWYRGDGITGGFRNGFRIAYILKELE